MKRESRLYMLLIVVPAIVGAIGWSWLVRTAWQKMWEDEMDDLDTQAELVAEVIAGRLGSSGRHIGEGPLDGDRRSSRRRSARSSRRDVGPRAKELGIDDGGDGPFGGRPPRKRSSQSGPSRMFRHGGISHARLAEACDSFASTNKDSTALAFMIIGMHGNVRYATKNYPAKTGETGSCRLGPPIGEGSLVVARADGGAGMRVRAAVFLVLGIGSTILLTGFFAVGGMLLMRMIRREQLDAQRKTDFFDNVSHELRTPLAGIRLNAELLSQGRIPDEKRRRGALEAILIESDRLGDMVESLLSFRRLERGTFRYRMESFDLAEFVRAESEIQAIAAVSKGRANVVVKEPGVVVEADRNALRQVGINLVTNAMKYSDGPIDIEVDGAEIRYMDRGPGVPRGDEERIFDRYYRVENSVAQTVGGIGIGLPIARALARGMGGDVVYSHRPGGGSVFTFKFRRA